MRITLTTYSTRPRGGVVHTLALAEALASLGHDVHVWTLARGGDTGFFRPVDPAVSVHAVPFPDVAEETVGQRVLRSIDTLGAAIDVRGSDIVHAQDCISANAAGPCLRTVHHIDGFSTPELVGCHDRAIRAPFAHVCVSTAVADELRSGWGIEATVIPNGVDAARFGGTTPSARASWRARLGPAPIVLAVGGIEPRKGTLDLLEATALLPDAHLVVAGGETLFDYRPYRAEFDARAAELAIPVSVLGPVDHDELPALMAEADVLGFPSTKEGFGLAAMEALAAGTLVVARDLPVLREVFGDTVRYGQDPASLANAIRAAIAAPGEHTERGRRLAEAHTWEAAATAHVALYERLTR